MIYLTEDERIMDRIYTCAEYGGWTESELLDNLVIAVAELGYSDVVEHLETLMKKELDHR